MENLCFYEGVTQGERVKSEKTVGAGPFAQKIPTWKRIPGNFNAVYDAKLLAPRLETSLTPAYHFSANSYTGVNMSTGSSISAVVGKELESGAPRDDRFPVPLGSARGRKDALRFQTRGNLSQAFPR